MNNNCLLCGQFSPFHRICPECAEKVRAGCFGGLLTWLVLALGVLAWVLLRGK